MDGADAGRDGGRRIALLLEYDGTGYRGSQYQDNGPSIQGELESAIEKLTGERVRAAFAGRTDAGVHALGQVAALDTRSGMATSAFVGGLNHFLPADIAVLAAVEAAPAFDPRRDARMRTYRYRAQSRAVRSPLWRERAWHIDRPLDVAAMRAAAAALEGTHDFAAFAGPYDGATVRTLRRCDVTQACGQVVVDMEAQSFLPHQVRRTMGALAEVGLGRVDAGAISAVLREAKPASSGPTAPACGLYLVAIEYDGLEWGLAEGNGRDA